jgi:type IV secretion system protein VirB2
MSRFRTKFSQIVATVALLAQQSAMAQSLSTDPQGSGVIVNAMRWVQGTLLGSVATVAAVIAIAVVGLLMLSGRINWRYGAIVILGCFILFGAASIVAGIQSAATLGVTVTVHITIKTAQTLTNKILDSIVYSLYVLMTRGDMRVLARAAA